LLIKKKQINTNDDKDVIKIGAIIPLTGPAGAVGVEVKNGIECAVEKFNNENISNRKQLKVIFEDSANEPKKRYRLIKNYRK
jgi:branched-chain amino acid transport system substrate-binding protein